MPVKRTYLRFNVQGVGSVSSARLWMFATLDNPTGFQLHSVSNNSWSETGINWNNAPSIGPAIASSGPVVAGNWYSVNVSSLVSGDGLVSFALSSLSSSSLNYTAVRVATRRSSWPRLPFLRPDTPSLGTERRMTPRRRPRALLTRAR